MLNYCTNGFGAIYKYGIIRIIAVSTQAERNAARNAKQIDIHEQWQNREKFKPDYVKDRIAAQALSTNYKSPGNGRRVSEIELAGIRAEADQRKRVNDPINSKNETQIRLVEQGYGGAGNVVAFAVRPEFSETTTVSYIPITDLRAATTLLLYMGTNARTFSMSAKLISRSEAEAAETYRKLNLLKAWTKPDKHYTARDLLGNQLPGGNKAPRVLTMYAYGHLNKGIPLVLTSLSIEFPQDVDYISFTPKGKNEESEVPIIMSINMAFSEIRSWDEAEAFDIVKYKTGDLSGW